jgi:geranylgeranyl diphosphate synthase type II
LVDQALDRLVESESRHPITLHKAMRYSLFAGGKRVRPILAIAAAEAVGGRGEDVVAGACAIEMIHTYSLIHDDLPAMDDDDLRRGRPTCHKVYGEAVAILTGDALLTLAFEVLSNSKNYPTNSPAEVILEVTRDIAKAAGSAGMVGGQVIDLEGEGKQLNLAELEYLHIHKTGEMILVSITTGAKLAQTTLKITIEQIGALRSYGEAIGLAFQIADDVLDIEGGEEIGKPRGSDLKKKKSTYPALLGLSESKSMAWDLCDRAIKALEPLDKKAEPLREIAKFIVYRKH